MVLRSNEIITRTPAPVLMERYRQIRRRTRSLCLSLQPEDQVVQSMPSTSPTKWHLAHTTWLFEQFILLPHKPGYSVFNDHFHYLFNSYYYTKGEMHSRPARGLLSRPGVDEINAYRDYVDEQMLSFMADGDDAERNFLVELGLNHEEQHQELILTDIKHAFSLNPMKPALMDHPERSKEPGATDYSFIAFEGGTKEIGADADSFHFDNESPRHQVLLQPFELASRPINNSEFRTFIKDGGYRQSPHWLADGWAWINEKDIDRPLYWSADLSSEFTLSGMQDLEPGAPVCHVSFYEADAFARWAGVRLPTEAEWEVAAQRPIKGNFMDGKIRHPAAAGTGKDNPLQQMFGDVWEWTGSSYLPYPGFRPLPGSPGEYNGKFMCNQMVCRGGSCVTPAGHIRASYRNFFYPPDRWQFFGIRLARDS